MISFHYVTKSSMYYLYNSLYHMRVFSITDTSDQLVKSRTTTGTDLIQALKAMAKESARPFKEMKEEREHDLAGLT